MFANQSDEIKWGQMRVLKCMTKNEQNTTSSTGLWWLVVRPGPDDNGYRGQQVKKFCNLCHIYCSTINKTAWFPFASFDISQMSWKGRSWFISYISFDNMLPYW